MNRVAIHPRMPDVILFVIEAMRFNDEDNWCGDARGLKTALVRRVNKVDRVFPRGQLLPFLEEMTERIPASGIIPISAMQSTT